MTKKLILFLVFTLPFGFLSLAKTWEVPSGSTNNKITIEAEFPGDAAAISCKIDKVPEIIKYIVFWGDDTIGIKKTMPLGEKGGENRRIITLMKYTPFKKAENRDNNKNILKKYEFYFDVDEKSKVGETGLVEFKLSDSFGRTWIKKIDIKITNPKNNAVELATDKPVETNKPFICGPNPFKISTEIKFSLAKKEAVQVSIYDIQGRLVKTIVNETVAPGTHLLNWDGKNNAGRYASNGVYFISIKTESFYVANKVVYIK